MKDSLKLSAWLVNNLDIPFKKSDTSEIKKKYPHLNGIEFPRLKDLGIILIGAVHADPLLLSELSVGRNGEPLAVNTKLD